jgi:hypothetical protein
MDAKRSEHEGVPAAIDCVTHHGGYMCTTRVVSRARGFDGSDHSGQLA